MEKFVKQKCLNLNKMLDLQEWNLVSMESNWVSRKWYPFEGDTEGELVPGTRLGGLVGVDGDPVLFTLQIHLEKYKSNILKMISSIFVEFRWPRCNNMKRSAKENLGDGEAVGTLGELGFFARVLLLATKSQQKST